MDTDVIMFLTKPKLDELTYDIYICFVKAKIEINIFE